MHHCCCSGGSYFEDAEVDVQKKFGAIIVLCQHNFLKSKLKDYWGGSSNYKQNCPIVELVEPDRANDTILCSVESGFYIFLKNQLWYIMKLDLSYWGMFLSRTIPMTLSKYDSSPLSHIVVTLLHNMTKCSLFLQIFDFKLTLPSHVKSCDLVSWCQQNVGHSHLVVT